jgi:uncharacterized RDD family membrane protein YckC
MVEQGITEHWLNLTSHTTTHVAGILAGGVVVLLLVGYLLLFLGALVSVLGSPQSGGMKLVWCLVVFAAPFLGSLLWFVIGKPNALRGYRRGY